MYKCPFCLAFSRTGHAYGHTLLALLKRLTPPRRVEGRYWHEERNEKGSEGVVLQKWGLGVIAAEFTPRAAMQ